MTPSLLPQTRNAIIKISPGHATITNALIPVPRPGYILVRPHAVALNPADWTDIDYDAPPSENYNGCIVGLDYAGVVVQTHLRDQRPSRFHVGDRICGVTHGCNNFHPEDGAFADYIYVKEDLQIRIPDAMDFERAASLGVGLLTVGMALYYCSDLEIPDAADDEKLKKLESMPDKWILIYGGSSSTGSIAIQFAKLSGLKVVTTCSPHNFELVKSFGADAVFDYRSPDVTNLIKTTTSYSLLYAFDTIATDTTAAVCASSFKTISGEAEGKEEKAYYICTLDPLLPSSSSGSSISIEKKAFLGYTLWGEDVFFEGEHFPASPEDYEFGVKFTAVAEKLLHDGKIRNHPIVVNATGKNGLEGVLEGLDLLRRGQVSGKKLVYTIQQGD